MPASDLPVSAGRLADELGHLLPAASQVPPAAFALVARTRELIEAVVMTDVAEADRVAAADLIETATDLLNRSRRESPLFLVRHSDGRVESLLQAGSGRLNPAAPPVEWVVRPTEPPPGSEPVPVEVSARCVFCAQHAGSPGRAYGGVLALVLDEVIGVSVRAAGASGMTVSLTVNLRGAAPLGVPVDITARLTGTEGRKAFASGEIRAGDSLVAEATGIYVTERVVGTS
jgi:acyl-coenzyme A thioesterase PaaI-like protein